MIHHCPKCNPNRNPLSVGAIKPLIWQPAKLRFWCRVCGLNFTRREAAVVEGGVTVELGASDIFSQSL